ncbi:MAG TPA: hypothetical protein VG454_08925 [Gemmatimonadales bacterium]|nr:hypothetical protein [Gemmatimonadales bacterium]
MQTPPVPPPAPPPPPPPPSVSVSIITPAGDTVISLGDSIQLVFRIEEGGLANFIPPSVSFSDSSMVLVVPQRMQALNDTLWLWGSKVGQLVAKVTVANVSDSVLISIAAPPPDPAGSPDYEVIDLGTLGGTSAIPLALNDHGQLVGSSLTTTGERHAFLWENGVMRDLAPDLHQSEATTITNSGTVGIVQSPDPGTIGFGIFVWRSGLSTRVAGAEGAGIGAVGEGGDVAFWEFDGERQRSYIWSDGQARALGGLIHGPDNVSMVQAMNGNGQIVGSAMTGEYAGWQVDHAFLWESGVMRDLGLLGEHPCDPPTDTRSCAQAAAVDINDRGDVVGFSNDASAFIHAVLWRNGVVRDLGPGRAIAINDTGDILGYRNEASFEGDAKRPVSGDIATFWHDGVATSLGSLGGGVTIASGLNNSGVVAGSSLTNSGVRHVFVWNSEKGMIDLGRGAVAAPAVGAQAVAINSRGDVLGFTYTVRCQFMAVIYRYCYGPWTTPVPTRAVLWRRKN